MKALRIGLVIALVATLALFAIPTSTPVNAQSGCTPQGSETWCIKYDYSTSAFGATVLFANGHDFGTYTGGTGFVAADDDDGGSGSTFRRVVVEAPLPTSVTVLRVKVTYNRVLGPYSACTGCAGFYIIDHSGGTYGSYVVNRSESGEDSAHGTSYSGSDTFTVSLTGLSALEYYLGVCVVTSGSCSGNGAITAIELAGTGGGIPTATPTPTMTPTPLASGPCSTGWTKTYDFTQQAYGFMKVPNGSIWNPGIAFASDDLKADLSGVYLGSGDHMEAVQIQRNIYATTINSGSVTIEYNPGSAGPSVDAKSITVSLGSTSLIAVNDPPAGSTPDTYSGSISGAGQLTILAVASGILPEGTPLSQLGSATIKSLTLSGTGYDPDGQCQTGGTGTPGATVWDYPLAQRDTLGGANYLELSLLNQNNPAPPPLSQPFNVMPSTFDTSGTFDGGKVGLIAFSQLADANVHSMTDGTVGSIVPIDIGNPCYYEQLPIFSPPPKTCGLPLADTTSINIDYATAYLIEVDTISAKVFYVVNSPEVQPGEIITAGCILGRTIKFYAFTLSGAFSFGGISVIAGSNLSSNGYTIVYGTTSASVPLDVLPFLQVDPPDKHCGQGSVGGCDLVANAVFAAPNSEWTALNADQPPVNPAGQTKGLLLIGGVRQSLNLDPSQSYIITVDAHLITPLSGGGRERPSLQGSGDDFTVQLGSTASSIIVVTSVNSQQTVIAATTYTPTMSGTQEFDLTIGPTDSTQSNIIVDYVCVSTSGSTPLEPSSCMFVNPDFNDSTGWTAGGGTTFSGGLAVMPNSGTLTQSVKLNPKDLTHSQDYVLTASARRQGAPSGSAHIDLAYTWNGGGSTALGSYSDQVFKTASSTFTVSSATTGNVVLTASGSSQVLELDSICITTSDGVTPPGYQIPPPISITATCKVCSYSPIGDVNYDLPEVIGWLECSLAQIWECEAKQILLGIWQALISILMFLGMMRLWFDYTIFSGTLWLNANLRVLTSWLNGQFVNGTNMLVDTIRYGPLANYQITNGGGSNFFDAIIALANTISNLFNQIGTLITSVRDVVLSFLDKLWSLLTLALTLIAAIITLIITSIVAWIDMAINFIGVLIGAIVGAINTAPVIPPGVPVCDMSASTIPENCVPIFVIDNTALADGGLLWTILPLIEGSIAFAAIWWAINQFKGAIANSE